MNLNNKLTQPSNQALTFSRKEFITGIIKFNITQNTLNKVIYSKSIYDISGTNYKDSTVRGQIIKLKKENIERFTAIRVCVRNKVKDIQKLTKRKEVNIYSRRHCIYINKPDNFEETNFYKRYINIGRSGELYVRIDGNQIGYILTELNYIGEDFEYSFKLGRKITRIIKSRYKILGYNSKKIQSKIDSNNSNKMNINNKIKILLYKESSNKKESSVEKENIICDKTDLFKEEIIKENNIDTDFIKAFQENREIRIIKPHEYKIIKDIGNGKKFFGNVINLKYYLFKSGRKPTLMNVKKILVKSDCPLSWDDCYFLSTWKFIESIMKYNLSDYRSEARKRMLNYEMDQYDKEIQISVSKKEKENGKEKFTSEKWYDIKRRQAKREVENDIKLNSFLGTDHVVREKKEISHRQNRDRAILMIDNPSRSNSFRLPAFIPKEKIIEPTEKEKENIILIEKLFKDSKRVALEKKNQENDNYDHVKNPVLRAKILAQIGKKLPF